MIKQFRLQSNFKPAGDQPRAIERLLLGIEQGFTKQVLLGVTGCGKTFAVANVIERLQRPALIIAPNKTLAAQLYGEMRGFFPENAVAYFVSYYDYYQPEAYIPTTNTYIEKDAAINEQIEQMRLAATNALLSRRDVIIVATVSAIYGLGDPSSYLGMVVRLQCGELVERDKFLRKLTELQYNRNELVLERGNYRAHGEVVDVFPADAERDAIRIEFDADRVERISYFDPITNKRSKLIDHITIFPKTHYVTARQNISQVLEEVRQELALCLKELYAANKLVEAQRLEERVRYDLEMMMELGYCTGIENYSRYLSKRRPGEPPPTLLDYLPKDALLFIDESHVTVPQLGAMYRGDRSRKETLVAYGFRLPSALDNRPLRFDEFEKISPATIYVSATPSDYELKQAAQVVELLVRPTGLVDPEVLVRPAITQVDDLLSEIKKCVERKERILVTTLTKKMSENLTQYLSEYAINVRYLHSDIDTVERMDILRELRLGVFDVLVGINLLREGLDLPEVALVAVLDADKEGFLRSTSALIQTSGRAARNLYGKVIMYADKITGSMQRAIDEIERRRAVQLAFNKEHNITPQGIKKSVEDILGHEPKSRPQKLATVPAVGVLQLAEEKAHYFAMTPQKLAKELKRLEKKMHAHARNLEFEEAAKVRDEIDVLRRALF